MPLSHLQIRNPKEDETGPEAATQIFSSLLSGQHSFLQKLFKEVDNYSFEIYLTGQSVYFYVTVDEHRESLLKSLIQSSYPLSSILKTSDPIDVILKK